MKINRILVIRRDNIGDLICTTPLFSTLREQYPNAHIAALVNSYNAPVINNNHDLDQVYIYRKAKHRKQGELKVSIWLDTIRLILKIRKISWDITIVATTGYSKSALKFAKYVRTKRIIAVAPRDENISDPIQLSQPETFHETELVFQLLHPLQIFSSPGKLKLHYPTIENRYHNKTPKSDDLLIGLHISARKPSQKWKIELFCELAKKIHDFNNAHFLLFWSPGASNHPQHPGDDDKAKKLINQCAHLQLPISSFPTSQLEELIKGISLCNIFICSDGGAMHIAAALNKPIVCMFGDSDPIRWHPWRVQNQLIQKQSKQVSDISVSEVYEAYKKLSLDL